MLQKTRKTLGFKKIMVFKIPPGGGKPYLATGLYIYIIYGYRKYICGKRGRGEGGGAKPHRSQRHLEISGKMESFPSYGSRISFFFFSLFLRPYYF